MTVVLGIDAAWTLGNASGVALVMRDGDGWRLAAVETSYKGFIARADGQPATTERPKGSPVDADALLAAAARLALAPVDLVTVDMPLSHAPIDERRASDDAVSRSYGGKKKAGTHSPVPDRPGPVSLALNAGFTAAGYPLRTLELKTPGLIEVYPHPALIELMSAPMRLCYKATKTLKYWPDQDRAQRRASLLAVWDAIVTALDLEIAGVSAALRESGWASTGWSMKAHEDKLDAVVCAYVGICALEGRAIPFGDKTSAIWIPKPNAR
jgi:predicted RNase H-like nuclease